MSEEYKEDEIVVEDEVVVEEVNDESNDEVIEESTGEELSPDDEVVERAKKYGHLSKEEWIAQGRDPAKYKSPEEFDKTGKLIGELYTLKKKLEQQEITQRALVEYQERTAQREYEKARKELEAKLNASKEDLDVEGVAHYTTELTKLNEVEQQSQIQRANVVRQSAQEAFIERNQHWFNDRNPDLKQRAIEIDSELKTQFPNASYEQLADLIEAKMIKEFPERVLGQQKIARPNVSPATSSVNKTAVNTNSVKRTFQSLSPELKEVYSAHKRIRESMGQELTEAEFIERLRKDGEI